MATTKRGQTKTEKKDKDHHRRSEVLKRVIFFFLGATASAMTGILPRLSRSFEGRITYDNLAAVGCAETVKFLISLALLTDMGRNVGEISLRWGAYREVLLYFSIPAALYALQNNADIIISNYMDPGTYQVLMQGKIATTSVLWWMAFRKPLLVHQWCAVVILTIGSIICAMQKADKGDKAMGILDRRGVFWALVCISCSTFASIITEWIYKKTQANQGIHVQNLAMYTWGILINWGNFFRTNGAVNPFQGFNLWTCALVLNLATLGLLMSAVMKYFSNITKLFVNGGSMYVSTLFAIFFFNLIPSIGFLFGITLVTLALGLYNLETVYYLLGYSPSSRESKKRS